MRRRLSSGGVGSDAKSAANVAKSRVAAGAAAFSKRNRGKQAQWIYWVVSAFAAAVIVSLVALVVESSGSGGGADAGGESESGFVIAGYAPEYRLEHLGKAENMALVGKFASDLIVFSAQVGASTGLIEFPYVSEQKVAAFAQTAKANGVSRVFLCVGGAGRSHGFAQAAKSKQSRTSFAKQARMLLEKHGLDGIDFDWEAPANDQENQLYSLLVQDTKREMGKEFLISLTIHHWQNFGKRAYDSADRINVMAYDLNRKHSTFEDSKRVIEVLEHKGQLAQYKHKMLLGIPAYGRGVNDPSLVKTYAEIIQENGESVSAKDETAASDSPKNIFFNGLETTKKKTKWAKGQGFAGVFFWEIGQDFLDNSHPELSLLAASAFAATT